MLHRIMALLFGGEIASAQSLFKTPEGRLLGGGTTVGNGIEGWAPGALFVDSNGGTGAKVYRNTGSITTATWTVYTNLQAHLNLISDSYGIVLGAGSDVKLIWDGTCLTHGPAAGFWAGCPAADQANPAPAFTFFDDFLELSLGDATSRWTLDHTQGEAILAAGETSGIGGWLKLGVTGTTAEDFAQIRLGSTDTGCAFKITKDSGKKLWYETSLKAAVNLADASCYFGLVDEAASEIGTDGTGAESVENGVYFRVLNDAPTELDTGVNKNTTETEVKANAGTLNTTARTYGFTFDGANLITFYQDGVALADTVAADATNFPHDEALTPAFFVKSGDTGGEYIYVDYVKIVQLR